MGVSLSTGNIIVASLEQIFHKEGLRGMYCGLAPTMLALLPFILPSIAVFLPNEIVPFPRDSATDKGSYEQRPSSFAPKAYEMEVSCSSKINNTKNDTNLMSNSSNKDMAGGLTEFGDGRNQQSTSEAVNSYYAVGLIGLAYGHTYLLTRPMESTKFQ
ncbi:hypothetical protein JHK85_004739 [Glycine max]|nr:hypothetical protein JHK85_004739 [Glycine max]